MDHDYVYLGWFIAFIMTMIGIIMFIESKVIGPSEARDYWIDHDCVYFGRFIGFTIMMIRIIMFIESRVLGPSEAVIGFI